MYLTVRAGFVYALLVFAIGFIVGTLRVLLLVPRVGETAAVTLEAPLMLAVSWMVSLWIVKRLEVPPGLSARSLLSAVAFTVLMTLELSVSVLVFHHSVAQHFAAYGSAPGVIGLAAQIAFASFPLLQTRLA